MSELVNLLPLIGALVMGAILLGTAKQPAPAPVPVRAKRHPRR